MGHNHSHSTLPKTAQGQRIRHKATIILTAILLPIFLISISLLMILWPTSINNGVRIANPYSAPAGASIDTGVVISTGMANCQGDESSLTKECFVAYTQPDSGGDQIAVPVNSLTANTQGMKTGDTIKYVNLTNISNGATSLSNYAFLDFVRTIPIGILAAVYALTVILVAGWKGIRAVLGLIVAYAIIAGFILPGIINGLPSLPITVIGSTAILFAVMYFSHGFSARTSTALLGTLFGLFTTAGITMLAMGTTYITGLADESNHNLLNAVPGISLSGIIICGMIIASLGVLNDVTITQASAVWELAELSPESSGVKIFKSAMKIGKDHIASTVYTISFAYVSTALPILMLALLYDRTLIDSLTGPDLVEEVVRTLVGSIGLVLAVPITTAIAVLVVKSSQRNAIPSAKKEDAQQEKGTEDKDADQAEQTTETSS
jgi:uncharacterized membrane protein